MAGYKLPQASLNLHAFCWNRLHPTLHSIVITLTANDCSCKREEKLFTRASLYQSYTDSSSASTVISLPDIEQIRNFQIIAASGLRLVSQARKSRNKRTQDPFQLVQISHQSELKVTGCTYTCIAIIKRLRLMPSGCQKDYNTHIQMLHCRQYKSLGVN